MSEAARGELVRPRFQLLLAAGCFIAWGTCFIARSSSVVDGQRWFCLFDDAMISMRYAWNLAHGDGLVWNAGERVEGITNLLQTLVMALFALGSSKGAAVLLVQCSGIVVILAAALLAARIAVQLLPGNRAAPFLGFAFAAAHYPLAYWSLMGMETGLLAVLLLGAVSLALHEREHPLFLGLALALAFLTRPDALIPAGLLLLSLALQRRPVRTAALVLVGAVVATTLFRFFYYGSPVPNTFVLKATGLPLGFRLRDGLGFVRPLLLIQALPLALGLYAAARQPRFRLPVALHLAALGYQIWIGGDPWPYWRMAAPTTPLLLIAAWGGAVDLAARVPPGWRGTVAGGAALASLACTNLGFYREMVFVDAPYQAEANGRNVLRAIALGILLKPGASVAVLWAGTIPYYTGLRSIDLLGKSDRHVASVAPDTSGAISWDGMRSVPGHNKYDLFYSIEELKPTYLETARYGRQDLSSYVDEHYAFIEVAGDGLFLLRKSPEVRWEIIHPPRRESPEAPSGQAPREEGKP